MGILLLLTASHVWLYLHGSQQLSVLFQRSLPEATGTQSVGEMGSRTPNQGLGNLPSWALSGGMALVLASGLGWALGSRVSNRRVLEDARKSASLGRELSMARGETTRAKQETLKLREDLRLAYDEMEARVQERTTALERSCQALEEELNSRRRAEKALTHQAKELERSKDVLEMHVQARTQELHKLKSRYEHILNSAGEGIYGLDLQGRTTFVNPAAAKLTGWETEEMVGQSEQKLFFSLPATAEGEQGEEGIRKDQNGVHLGEQVLRRKDGSEFTAEYIRTPIKEKDRRVGAVVIFKDITERKRTEAALAQKAEELARSNGELEQFAYVASHDLQEPLRKIRAFGDRLKSKCDMEALKEGRDYLERMLGAAARMQTLINDLLTFSRVITTSQPFVPVSLMNVTREVLSDLEVRIEQTKARIELAELPTVEADPTQMRQLLQNLISNALKFSKPGQPPTIEISAAMETTSASGGDGDPAQEICRLQVKDNGIGFDERYLDKIFAVFQRLHGRSEYEGTGVGLAVCRRITDRHSGKIMAHSRPGEGATFIVTLPVRQKRPEPTA